MSATRLVASLRLAATSRIAAAAVAPPSASRYLSTTALRSNAQSTTTPPPSQDDAAQPGEQTTGEQQILTLLTQRFKPGHLKVQDVSGGCGSFYAIAISSKEFKGLSTIKQHRLVNSELKDVIKDIHGLQLRTIAED